MGYRKYGLYSLMKCREHGQILSLKCNLKTLSDKFWVTCSIWNHGVFRAIQLTVRFITMHQSKYHSATPKAF